MGAPGRRRARAQVHGSRCGACHFRGRSPSAAASRSNSSSTSCASRAQAPSCSAACSSASSHAMLPINSFTQSHLAQPAARRHQGVAGARRLGADRMTTPAGAVQTQPAQGAAAGGEDAAAAMVSLDALVADVARQPWAYDFFALMRRLDTLHPRAPRTGCALRPGQEPWRLSQVPELDFAPAAIAAWNAPSPARRGWVCASSGCSGPRARCRCTSPSTCASGVLHHGDATLAHFLDLFHHRLLLLFYRAWAQAQPVGAAGTGRRTTAMPRGCALQRPRRPVVPVRCRRTRSHSRPGCWPAAAATPRQC